MKHEGAGYVFKNEVEYFDSYSEALQVAKTRKTRRSMFGSWAGGILSWDEAEKMDRAGWSEGAKQLTAAFDAASMASLTTSGDVMGIDYAGYMPCVPSYLAGEPMHMRRKVPCETSKAPITIVVGIGSSAGIGTKTMEKRAAAIACLVLYLSVYRAVTVYMTVMLQSTRGEYDTDKDDYYLPMIKVGTTPVDLPQLAWQLVHPFSARGTAYTLGNYGESGITWAQFKGKSAYSMTTQQVEAKAREILGLNPEDIYIPDVKLDDHDMHNPEQWAKTRLKAMGYDV